MTRYTLSFMTKSGRVTLYNLGATAVAEIKAVQSHLGSTDFEVTIQPHHYCQLEIDLIKSHKGA